MLTFLSLLPAPGDAFARDAASAAVEVALRALVDHPERIVERSRRMNALGLTAGGFPAFDTRSGRMNGYWSIGIGYFLFQDPIMDLGSLKDSLLELAQMKLSETKGKVSERERKRLLEELLAALRKRVMDWLQPEPSPWPKPIVRAGLELAPSFQAGGGSQLRVGLGLGLSHFHAGPTAAYEGGDDASGLLGLELGTAFLLGRGPRPLLLDSFLRYDLRYGSVTQGNSFALGARLLFDLI